MNTAIMPHNSGNRGLSTNSFGMPDLNLGISEVFNIILSLIFLFQWWRNQSREEAVKYHLLAVREMVKRTESQSSPDIMGSLDATLATLGTRRPYVERCRRILLSIGVKFHRSENAPLLEVSPISLEDLSKK
jgi:hypothetical protein